MNNTDLTLHPQARPKILIVVHGNEYIEVFCETRDATVKIVNVPAMHTASGELVIEELLSVRLTQPWAKVHGEGYLIDRDAIRDIKVTDIIDRDEDCRLHSALSKIINGTGHRIPAAILTTVTEVSKCLAVS